MTDAMPHADGSQPPEPDWNELVAQARCEEIWEHSDEAEMLYALAAHEAMMAGDDLAYCLSVVALSVMYLQKQMYKASLALLDEALELRQKHLAPCHELVAEVHHLLAITYQLDEQYEPASKHWIAVIQCFSWLPSHAPILRQAAEELLFCRGKQVGMPEPQDYWGLSRREVA